MSWITPPLHREQSSSPKLSCFKFQEPIEGLLSGLKLSDSCFRRCRGWKGKDRDEPLGRRGRVWRGPTLHDRGCSTVLLFLIIILYIALFPLLDCIYTFTSLHFSLLLAQYCFHPLLPCSSSALETIYTLFKESPNENLSTTCRLSSAITGESFAVYHFTDKQIVQSK